MAEYGCQTSGMRKGVNLACRAPISHTKCQNEREKKTSIEGSKSREKESSKFLERKV